MEVQKTEIEGVLLLKPNVFKDIRGSFVKTFNEDDFLSAGISAKLKECFYSESRKNVIRGIHFHTPPKQHKKIVYVISGSILDVIIDLRKKSSTYGKIFSVILSKENNYMVHIPEGCGHGFLSLEDQTVTAYMQTGGYSKEHDSGISPLSIDFDWGIKSPILSDRDKSFVDFENFISPFS